jgi:hypothetical protein
MAPKANWVCRQCQWTHPSKHTVCMWCTKAKMQSYVSPTQPTTPQRPKPRSRSAANAKPPAAAPGHWRTYREAAATANQPTAGTADAEWESWYDAAEEDTSERDQLADGRACAHAALAGVKAMPASSVRSRTIDELTTKIKIASHALTSLRSPHEQLQVFQDARSH